MAAAGEVARGDPVRHDDAMTTVVIVLIVLAALVGGLLLLAVTAFNKPRTSDIAAQEALAGIDVQLTRRADLIPQLVETVRGYAAHEKGVFEAVTEDQISFARQYHNDAPEGHEQAPRVSF